jgi:hypothetical protein
METQPCGRGRLLSPCAERMRGPHACTRCGRGARAFGTDEVFSGGERGAVVSGEEFHRCEVAGERVVRVADGRWMEARRSGLPSPLSRRRSKWKCRERDSAMVGGRANRQISSARGLKV